MRLTFMAAVLLVSFSGCTFPEDRDDGTGTATSGTFPIVVIFGSGDAAAVTATLTDDTGATQQSKAYRLQNGQRELTPLQEADMPCDGRTRWLQVTVAYDEAAGAAREAGRSVACDGTPYSIRVPAMQRDPDVGQVEIEEATLYPGWERGQPWVYPPQLSFQKSSSGGHTVWTVTRVINGPVAWADLSVSCSSGAAPGGDAGGPGNVAAGDTISCPGGDVLTISHHPTQTVLYRQS